MTDLEKLVETADDQKLAGIQMRLQTIESEVYKSRTSGIGMGIGALPILAGGFLIRRRNRKTAN